MDIKGEVALEFSQADIWNAFMDPAFVAQVIPGCDALTPAAEPDAYTANLKIRIGPVQGRFKADLVQYDKEPMERFRLRVEARGPTGFITGSGQVNVVPQGPHAVIHYAGEVNVGGRIARLGQRLVETTARTMINRGIDGFRTRLQEALAEREEQA